MDSSFLFIILLAHFICLPPFSVAGFCATYKTQNITQFCYDQTFDSNDLYLDTYKAATRKTRCYCYFTSGTDTIITLSTKDYPSHTTTSCKTTSRIEYEIYRAPGSSGIICGYAVKQIDIRKGQSLYFTFYNELANLENYCLNIKTTASPHTLYGECYSDGFAAVDKPTNLATTSVQSIVTTEEIQGEAYTSAARIFERSNTIRTLTFTTIYSTTNDTTDSKILQGTSSKHGVPLTILLPSVSGWLFFIILVAIVVIYFIRRNKRDNQTVQNKHIERAGDEDKANHTDQALVNMENEYTVVGGNSGVSEQVRETNTDEIGEYSEVSPQSTVVVTANNSSDCNEEDGYLMPHDIKMKDSEPGSVYVTLDNDNENGKEQDYTSLEPGSVYTTLNKERNDQQEYTTMAFGKGRKREHRREPTKK